MSLSVPNSGRADAPTGRSPTARCRAASVDAQVGDAEARQNGNASIPSATPDRFTRSVRQTEFNHANGRSAHSARHGGFCAQHELSIRPHRDVTVPSQQCKDRSPSPILPKAATKMLAN